MSNARLLGALLAAGLATSGCAPYVSPVPRYGPGFASPLFPTASAVAVDPSASARGRWDNVMLLQPDSVLSVLTMDGQQVGTLIRADGYGVRLLADGLEQQIARDEVMRIDLVHLPGSDVTAVARRTAGGALLGAGAAALFAGVLGGPPGRRLACSCGRERRLAGRAPQPRPSPAGSRRSSTSRKTSTQ